MRANTFRPRLEPLDDRVLPSFNPVTAYEVGSVPVGVVSADFNNDGRLDLALVNGDWHNATVLLATVTAPSSPPGWSV